MASSAMDIYNQALQQQQGLYKQVQSGYQQLRADLVAGQTQVTAGYNRLSDTVQGTIGNIGRAQAEQIARQYTAQSGQTAQQLTNRGLGNTTVSNVMQQGIALDKTLADTDLQDRIAQTQAQYLTQIGLQGLGYQGSAYNAQMDLGNAALGSVQRFGNTFAGLYGGMADAAQRQEQMQQANQQATLDRMYAKWGQAGAQGSRNAATSQAMGQADRQLAFRYASLAADQGQAESRLGLGYAQLGQQANQFQQNQNQAYDFRYGNYGAGAPNTYTNRVETPRSPAGSSSSSGAVGGGLYTALRR
jgi:hypothetical protein